MDVDIWLQNKEARDDSYRKDKEDDRNYFEALNRTLRHVKQEAGTYNVGLKQMKAITLEVSKCDGEIDVIDGEVETRQLDRIINENTHGNL